MKKTISLVIILFIAFLAAAQQSHYTQNIRGIVLDADSHTPLPGVNIMLLSDSRLGSTTNNEGEFVLSNVPVGRQNIEFSFIGYKPVYKRNIQIQTGKELYLEIEMTELIQELNEVVIKAEYNKSQTINKMAAVSARSFSIEETERYAGSLGDPSRMAQNFAGVISAGDKRNDIVIRGNSPTGLLWQMDGIPIPNPNHFGAMGSTGGPVSMLNNNLLSNSDFFTGAYPAEYGNAISGVFDLNMRNGNNQNRQYVFQVGFNGFELGTEGPFVKNHPSSYLINYRYSTLAVVDMLGVKGMSGAVPEYQDLTFKVNVPTKKAGTFNLSGIGGTSYIKFDQEADNDGTYGNASGINTKNGSDLALINLSHLYFFSEKTRLKSWVSASAFQVQTLVDSIDYKDSTRSEILKEILYFREQNREYKIQAGTKLSSKLNQKNTIDFGLSFHSTQVDYLDSALYHIDTVNNDVHYKYVTRTDIHGDYLNLMQAYAQWKHRFTDDLSLYAGLHAQYLLFNDSKAVEPRLNIHYQLAPRHSLSLGYGLHSITQPGITYFTQSLIDTVEKVYAETNKNLGFTKSHQTALAYDFVISENLRLKLESYYQHLYNVPIHESFSNLNYGAGFNFPRVDSLNNGGLGRNYGIELTIEKFLSSNYYFLVTASLFESEFKNPNTGWRNTAFNNQYVINALGGFEFPINERMFLNLNIKAVLAGGNPLLAINMDMSEKYNTTIYNYSKSYTQRGPAYFRADSRISLKVNGKNMSQEWAFDIQNFTNHKNVFNQEYYVNENGDSDVRYNYQQGFFPMFLYRLNF